MGIQDREMGPEMEFSATVERVRADFDIQWGDGVRVRDVYTPYYELGVQVCAEDREKLPALAHILLYSFEMHAANVWDAFDPAACLDGSKFGGLEAGRRLYFRGALHCKLASHDSERFNGYPYVMADPRLHGRTWDVNGNLFWGITEWLVEAAPVRDAGELKAVSRLVIAWECAGLA